MKNETIQWVVWWGSKGDFPANESLAFTKSGSIKKFIKGNQLTWRQWKSRYGCKCIKTKITYEQVKEN
jgi:hypothetical protein